MMRSAAACRPICCSGRPCAGQKRAAARNMTCGACQTPTRKRLKPVFSSRSDGLWGVYRFKRGFGGQLLRSAGAWDRAYLPLVYPLYRWWAGGGGRRHDEQHRFGQEWNALVPACPGRTSCRAGSGPVQGALRLAAAAAGGAQNAGASARWRAMVLRRAVPAG
jgi:hypothetical protein